ncbi:MAG: HlyD family efflux transporter periplasmic adaptor subunit [Planctomycetales bacterium]|nr:HlyD family efflux transporter periplasmic adaptor subunit [Planctomycetales bacterium]
MATRLIVLALLAAVLLAALVYQQSRVEPSIVSGFVEADEIRVGSRVGGRVKEVYVVEGQQVEPEDLLVELEPFDLAERLAEAQARAQAAEAELARLEAGFRREEILQGEAYALQLDAQLELLRAGPREQTIGAAEARLDAARSEARLAEQNFRRAQEVFERGAATQEEMDRATEQNTRAAAMVVVREQELAELQAGSRPEEIRAAEAALEQAKQQLALTRDGFREEEVDAARAARDAAKAAVEVVRKQMEELRVVAPNRGTVEAVDLQPGDLVAAGAPVLSLMDRERLWVRAYVPENRLHLSVGATVELTVDSFPGESFRGTVAFISRQAEFTPSNVQTPEERSKQVFRIKVTLAEGAERLRPGMAADVHLDSAQEVVNE